MSEEALDILKELRDEVRGLREQLAETRSNGREASGLLTREEAADRLRVSTRTLDDLRDRGEISATQIGGRVLYNSETLDAYIRQKTG